MEDIVAWLRLHRWAAYAAAGGLLVLWLLAAEVGPRVEAAVARWQDWQAQRERLASVVTWEIEQTHIQARRLYLRQRFSSLYVNLPRGDQMSIMLGELQRHAARRKVRLEAVRPGESIGHPSYDELPVAVALQGTYHAVGRFVDDIERSPYLMKVESIDVEAIAQPAASTTGLQARLRLTVITLREQQAP